MKVRKIMHVTDLHLNPLHRIPQSRNSKFHCQISEKWDCVCSNIREQDIDLGIISGDIFHLKNPKIYCSEDITYYTEMFERSGIQWLCIPGNHELPESSFGQLRKTPYNLLMKATNNLTSLVSHKDLGGSGSSLENIKLNPMWDCFMNVFSIPINILGLPYLPLNDTINCLPHLNEFASSKEGFNLLLLHMDVLVDPNIFLFWPVAGYDKVLDLIPNFSCVCLGHIHQSFPVYNRISPITNHPQLVSKPWSFSRVAKDYFNKVSIYEKLHKPSYSVITLTEDEGRFNVSVEYKIIDYAPFEEAFKQDSLKKQIENNVVIKDFIEQVKKNFGDVNKGFSIIDSNAYYSSLEMPKEVRDMINKYLEES